MQSTATLLPWRTSDPRRHGLTTRPPHIPDGAQESSLLPTKDYRVELTDLTRLLTKPHLSVRTVLLSGAPRGPAPAPGMEDGGWGSPGFGADGFGDDDDFEDAADFEFAAAEGEDAALGRSACTASGATATCALAERIAWCSLMRQGVGKRDPGAERLVTCDVQAERGRA